MRIVVYFTSMAPAGGIERVISSHIKFLAEHHEVILLTHDKRESFYKLPGSVKHESLNVEMELDMSSRLRRIVQIAMSFLTIIRKIRTRNKKWKPDMFYVATPLAALLTFLAIGSGKKILVTEHASNSSYNTFYKKIADYVYRKVGLLTVPTTMDSDFYRFKGIPNEYLPNPLPFNPEQYSNLESKTVLHVGRFTDDKQHVVLLEIWNKVKAREKGWKLKLIGKGENEALIKDKIRELGLEYSVQLMPPTKKIIDEYLLSSVFVLTSRGEGFGLVLAEAMSCGVPCVSFNCPSGPRDIVENGSNGFLVEPTNNDAFSEKIDFLCSNKEERKRMGNYAKISVQKFSEAIVSEKLYRLVENKFHIL